MNKDTANVLLETCSIVLASWVERFAKRNKNTKNSDILKSILKDDIIAKILVNKIKWAEVDIIIPDELLLIISICAQRPGFAQLMLVDILDTIYDNHDKSIPSGYEITPEDFGNTFKDKFPIIELYPEYEILYDMMWDDQKFKDNEYNSGFMDNKIDTKEFWSKYRNM